MLGRCIIVISILLSTSLLAGERVDLKHFASLPSFSSPIISPNGQHLAVTIPIGGRPVIVVQNIYTDENGKTPQPGIVALPEKYHFHDYKWINNDRLLMSLRATGAVHGELRNVTRMWTTNRWGKDSAFFKVEPNSYGYYRQYPRMISPLKDDHDHILLALEDYVDDWAAPNVDKVNIHTGKKKRLIKNLKGVNRWIADDNGVVRIGTRYDGRLGRKNFTVFYRETHEAPWERLQDKTDYFDKERLTPIRFDSDDPNILLMTSDELVEEAGSLDDEDNIFRFDLTTRKVLGPYKDTYREKIKAVVERALPDFERQLISQDEKKQKFVFRVSKDTKAPEYYLLDMTKPSLDYIGAEYPGLDDVELAPMQKVSYTARDGLEVEGFLTLPVGSNGKDVPMVIYPHGGPWAHDEWGFDNYVQFMASRGYGVFQPQFRGSTGYGLAHEQAGYGQWGLGIQDDITDGLGWLIAEGIADPDRVCIVGSSFGGYAAAMGAAKTPELYQCAVTINGVLDLKRFNRSARNLFYGNLNKAIWNNWEDLLQTSPHHLAENIEAPILIIGSEKDTVVPIIHSKKMHQRLKRLKKESTFIELPGGEHYRTNEKNELTKFKAIEKFLNQHIGDAER
ncbi:prolyl oligopeptidase family serine peptidase [Porticoccaceae bacterium]|nr:prolyl oligopeptidase family serine peptidase [Porticoccaceae bacterium]